MSDGEWWPDLSWPVQQINTGNKTHAGRLLATSWKSHTLVFFNLLTSFCFLSFFFLLPPVSPLYSPLLIIHPSSDHHSRQCSGRGGQLHSHPFHLDCPEPSVYQRHQPGLQGQSLPRCRHNGALPWLSGQSRTCSIGEKRPEGKQWSVPTRGDFVYHSLNKTLHVFYYFSCFVKLCVIYWWMTIFLATLSWTLSIHNPFRKTFNWIKPMESF